MRALLVGLLFASAALGQGLILPRLITFGNGCDTDDNDAPGARTLTVRSESGNLSFTAQSGAAWLRVAPTSGTATTAGFNLTLTVDASQARRGVQRGPVFIRRGNIIYVVSVEVECIPTPTLIVNQDTLTFTLDEGGPEQQQSFVVENNNQTAARIEFDIVPETYGTGWISYAGQAGQPVGRGVIPNANTPALVTVRVNPQQLGPGSTLGYVHLRDRAAPELGNDTVEISVTVVPRPATLSVSTEPLTFSWDGATSTPPSRTLTVGSSGDSRGQSLEFTARPTTTSGGSWLRVNNSTSPTRYGTPYPLPISVAPSGLGPGTYSGSIELIPVGAPNVTVPVQLTVGQPPQDPRPVINSVSDGAGAGPVLSPGAWASIFGSRLAPDTPGGRQWRDNEFIAGRLPMSLDGVSVTVGGRPAAVYYIADGQINFQVPSDAPLGNAVAVAVTTSRGTGQFNGAQVQAVAPVFFPFGPTRHIAAQHGPPDYAYLGPPGLIPGLTLTPARPGEIVLLYGTGFGPTEPQTPSGVIVGSGARVVTPLTVRIGGVQAAAQGFISAAGLYVLVVTVPETLPDGDHAVVAELGSARTQNNMTISVRR